MKKTIGALIAAVMIVIGASPAVAGPKDVIRWLKDPCVPTGDLEDDCRLPQIWP